MKRKEDLLKYLWEFQHEKGFISNSEIRKLSEELKISMVEVEGVISFYHFFHRQPTGKYTIYLNNSIVSEIKGFHKVKIAFEKATGTRFGNVDPSGTFGLFETSCIGLNDQEPAALINFRPFVNLTPEKVESLIDQIKKGVDLDELMDEVEDNVIYTPGEKAVLFRPYEMGKSLKKLIGEEPEYTLHQIKQSAISGRGGAFFPTGLKWEFAKRSERKMKYVVCNADEGEPGTFKDRVLLNQQPGLLLEGMIIGAFTIGASWGYIYLRAEYLYMKEKIENTIQAFRDAGYLGNNILGMEGFNFDIEIKMGAGAYVCGEETALIESMEGKRGIPRTKVYFPVEKGYMNKPTIVNNVETFSSVSRIIELGADFYSSLGTPKSTGTKLISVSGDCEKPGIYEIEFGMKISELLEMCGADDPKFVQVSGPSGTLISEKEFDRHISREDLICGGSFMIFNKSRNLFEILYNFAQFFRDESCGVCTPCRAGNYLVGKRLDKIIEGEAIREEVDEIKKWSQIIIDSSRCGLGKTSTNCIIDAINKFPEEFDSKIVPLELMKEFDLNESINDYVDFALQTNGNK